MNVYKDKATAVKGPSFHWLRRKHKCQRKRKRSTVFMHVKRRRTVKQAQGKDFF